MLASTESLLEHACEPNCERLGRENREPVSSLFDCFCGPRVTANHSSGHAKAECIVVGGRLFKAARVAVGIAAVDAYRMLRPDTCVLGAAGIHPEAGVTTFDGEEAEVKRAMLEHSTRVIVVVAGEKLGTVAPYLLTPITKMTHLVTDRSASPDVLRTLGEMGIEVVLG